MDDTSLKTPGAIGVVIPAYNGQDTLAETVHSVLNQSLLPVEIVLSDDGSTDGTYALMQQLATERRPLIQSITGENAGPSAARNRGYRHLSGDVEFVLFLDADDLLEDNALETLRTALQHSPDAVGAYGAARDIDGNGEFIPGNESQTRTFRQRLLPDGSIGTAEESGRADFSTLVIGNCITTPGALLLRRSALEQGGLFETSLSGTADWELWTRLSLLGDFVALDNTPVIRYRRQATSMSSNARRMTSQGRKARRLLFEQVAKNPARRSVAVKAWKQWRAETLSGHLNAAWQLFRSRRIGAGCRRIAYAMELSLRHCLEPLIRLAVRNRK